MDLAKMDALIGSWKPEIFEKLNGWIAINSVKGEPSGDDAPFGPEVRRMLDLFLRDAEDMGFVVDDVDGYAGAAEMGAGDKTMGILVHLDIVPAGDGWTQDPFTGTLREGKYYGRGAQDDKGPAIAALYAMRAVKEAGIPLKHKVRLIAGCDEETGMSDMAYYRKVRPPVDYGFSPDAEYPLINIEKGGLGLLLSKACGGEEGAQIPVYSLNAGTRPNIVPGTATAELGTGGMGFSSLEKAVQAIEKAHPGYDLKLTDLGNGRAQLLATGKQSHAAMPELGLNAAGMLLTALKELNAGGGVGEAIRGLAKLLGTDYTGAGLGIAQADELSGPLTCNLGILRFDGRFLSAQLDIRYPLCADEADMCGRAAMALSPWQLALTRLSGHPPLHVPAESEVVRGLLQVYGELTGLPAYAMAIGGGTYARTMPNTVAFGICFPGDTDTCHMPDEYIEVDKFMLSIRIMAHAIVRLAGA